MKEGPAGRAVALARILLLAFAVVWTAAGIAFLLLAAAPAGYWGLAMIAIGLGHFIAARYASARLALFLAFFGP